MQVTFDINDFPDMVLAAREILDYAAGKIQSVDIKMFDGAIFDLQRAWDTCDVVPEPNGSYVDDEAETFEPA